MIPLVQCNIFLRRNSKISMGHSLKARKSLPTNVIFIQTPDVFVFQAGTEIILSQNNV